MFRDIDYRGSRIHKFNQPVTEPYSERDDIIVIFGKRIGPKRASSPATCGSHYQMRRLSDCSARITKSLLPTTGLISSPMISLNAARLVWQTGKSMLVYIDKINLRAMLKRIEPRWKAKLQQ